MSSVGAALATARRRVQRGEASILLRHVLGCSAAWLAAHPEAPLTAAAAARFAELTQRRVDGEPIAYLTGVREFYGRDFNVSPAVLIPRPETELLVDAALAELAALDAAAVVDLGCGSGCIAITIALEAPQARVCAVDAAPAAIQQARANAERLGACVDFVCSDWFAALRPRQFDLIVANPPYVAAGDAHLERGDLRFEPRMALTPVGDGGDGLAALRRIISAAPAWLAPGGLLLLEHGADQGDALQALLAEAFVDVALLRDLAGCARVSCGRRR